MTANAFERPTWTFSGWSTNKEAATPEYGNQAQFSATKDTTLYAIWTDNGTVTPVTFTSQDGTKFFYGETVTVTLSTNTEGATIEYKLDDGQWQDYSSPIEILSQNTITAKAKKEGLKDSEITSISYLRKLTSITITPPTRTVYSVGDEFDPTGMVVTATYDDGETREVNTWTTDFDEITSKHGLEKTVTVSYSEGEITQSTTFTVVVFPEDVKVLTDYKSPNHTDDTWTYVAFGEWPQTKANVEGISLQQVDGGRGYFKDNYYTDGKGNYYVKVIANPYEDGYIYSDNSGVTEDVEVYFKVEPIVWRVLTEDYTVPGENGELESPKKALLLAENILTGGIPYYVDRDDKRTITGAGTKEKEPDTVYPNNYKYSTIRAWLNGSYETDDTQEKNYKGMGFLQTAFTENAQKKIIVDTEVDNSAQSTNPESNATLWNSGKNEYACGNTRDKIFLLSEQEATMSDYGFGVYNASDNTRIRVTTDYAKATGANQHATAGYGGWWWLRSPHYDSEFGAYDIRHNGGAGVRNYVNDMREGIVPALCIELQ